jgi:hypothetical protein
MYYCEIPCIYLANNFTQAHEDEWVKDSGLSEVNALLDLVSLDDRKRAGGAEEAEEAEGECSERVFVCTHSRLSLLDTRVIVLSASQSTSAISEVL